MDSYGNCLHVLQGLLPLPKPIPLDSQGLDLGEKRKGGFQKGLGKKLRPTK